MRKIALAAMLVNFLFIGKFVWPLYAQTTASYGITYTVLNGSAGGAGTNSSCYIVPAAQAPLITWDYTFASAPASVTMTLQGSNTDCLGTFYTIDTGTNVAGEIRFALAAPKAIRTQITAKSGGGNTTSTFSVSRYNLYQGGVLTRQLRAANGLYTAPGISFAGSMYDGFYWLSPGAIVYGAQASPTMVFSSGMMVGSATRYCFGSSTSAEANQTGNLGDIGFTRLEAGILNLSKCDAAGGTGGAIKLGDPGTRPTCDLAHRGTIFNDEGASLTKDAVAVCAKDASDVYAWRVIY